MSLALILCSTSRIVCKCASYHSVSPGHPFKITSSPYLGPLRSIIDRHVQTPPQRTLGIASTQKLPHLAVDLADLGLADLGLFGAECGGVEVDGGILGEGIDVDGAPGVAEGGAGVLLDNGHCGGVGGMVRFGVLLRRW